MKRMFIALVVLVLATTTLSAQITPGGLAITGLVGGMVNNGVGIGYGLSENLKVNGVIGFSSISNDNGGNFGFGASGQYYLNTTENVSTFVGAEFGLDFVSFGGGTSDTYVNVGAFLGAEYWFSPKFSWAGTVGFGLSSGTNVFIGTNMSSGLTWWFSL